MNEERVKTIICRYCRAQTEFFELVKQVPNELCTQDFLLNQHHAVEGKPLQKGMKYSQSKRNFFVSSSIVSKEGRAFKRVLSTTAQQREKNQKARYANFVRESVASNIFVKYGMPKDY